MQILIDFGRGPLFRFAVALAVLGLLRYVVLSALGLRRAIRRAGDRRIAYGPVILRTIVMLNPLRYFSGNRWRYSVVSAAFHVGLILVPVFLAGHIKIWRRGIGIGWPALPVLAAEVLTIITAAAGVLLFAGRLSSRASRGISRPQDWLLPPLISLEFLTGYLLAHPGSNPLGLDATMLVHVGVGDLLLLLTPFTKIVHCVMLPYSQFVLEMAWRMVPGAGREVVKTLGKEGQPI
jgi:hypothetical protein